MKNSYRKYMLKPDFIGSNRGGSLLCGSVLAGAGDSTFCPVVLWGAGRDRKQDYNRKLIRSKRCAPEKVFKILEDLGHFEDFGELFDPEFDSFDIQIFMKFQD